MSDEERVAVSRAVRNLRGRKVTDSDLVTLVTNWHERELVSWLSLDDQARLDFGYIFGDDKIVDSPIGMPDAAYATRFFRYRGSWYDVQEFVAIVDESVTTGPFFTGIRTTSDSVFYQWDAAQTESYFSAVVIKWGKADNGSPDYESVIVGYAHW